MTKKSIFTKRGVFIFLAWSFTPFSGIEFPIDKSGPYTDYKHQSEKQAGITGDGSGLRN
jgi:hypothetical protein